MKILKVHKDIEVDYVAMFMSITKLVGDTHKRYWISEYSKLEIPIPSKAEQKANYSWNPWNLYTIRFNIKMSQISIIKSKKT